MTPGSAAASLGTGSAAGTSVTPTRELVDFLDLEHLERDLFRGWCHDGAPTRAFGGQVAAQTLTAAGRTVDGGRRVHSLHGYFLRVGDARRPVVYRVERLREGRSYATRQVTAIQGGDPIFTLTASFKYVEAEQERQRRMPTVPPPEVLRDAYRSWGEANPEAYRAAAFARVASLRIVPAGVGHAAASGSDGEIGQCVWLRAYEQLPDDPLVHAAALTYYSDLTFAQTATLVDGDRVLFPFRDGPSPAQLASLDHAMWFHRPFRADEWLLFAQRSPSAGDGRGFNVGDFWTRDGTLVASVAQESVLRWRRPGVRAEADQVGQSKDLPSR